MTAFLLGLTIGLVVGWNLLPQPAWVRRIYERVLAWARATEAADKDRP